MFFLWEPFLLVSRRGINYGPATLLGTVIIPGIVLLLALWAKLYQSRSKTNTLRKNSKFIKEETVNKALAKGEKIFISTIHLEGIAHFTENCMVILELLPYELRINEVKLGKANDPIHTASLPYSRIIDADVVELEKRDDDKALGNTALYFVISYLSEGGEEKRLLFNQPTNINYALFMSVLEKRIPYKVPKSAEILAEKPSHIEL